MTAIDERGLVDAELAIRSVINADATGLAPAVIGHYLTGFEEAARLAITAYLQALRPGSTGETEGWRELMKELADDLECELQARYPEEARAYPSQAMKFYADMEPVRRARAMLAAAGGREG